MNGKTAPQLIFNADLKWEGGSRGIISTPLTRNSLTVTASPEFGGTGGEWTPEHLYLSAFTSCFMSTFLEFVKKLKFNISDFECAATGQVEVIEGKYQFTFIHLYPKVLIENTSDKEKATLAMNKTEKYCLISNSVKAGVFYHPEIEVKEKEDKKQTSGKKEKKPKP